MDSESVNTDDLKTDELINGPILTHMRGIFNLITRMSGPVLSGQPVDIELFSELQLTTANLFRDITILTLRFGVAIARGYLE